MSHLLPAAAGGAQSAAHGRAAQEAIVAPRRLGGDRDARRDDPRRRRTRRARSGDAAHRARRAQPAQRRSARVADRGAAENHAGPVRGAIRPDAERRAIRRVVPARPRLHQRAGRHAAGQRDGTAAQAAKAFNTSLHAFSAGRREGVRQHARRRWCRRRWAAWSARCSGFRTPRRCRSRRRLRTQTNCFPSATPTGQCVPLFSAQDVQTFYDAGATPTGSATTVAVIAEGDVSQTVSDLRVRGEQAGSCRRCPSPSSRSASRAPTPRAAAEWDLDTQSSTGMAQNVSMLYIYDTTSLSDSDIANAYSQWVSQNVAQLGNSSFGECELMAWLDGAMKVDDHLFMQAAAQGQTMFVSTGDTGSSCALAPTNGAPMFGAADGGVSRGVTVRRRRRRHDGRLERVGFQLRRRSRVERGRRRAEPVRELDELAAGGDPDEHGARGDQPARLAGHRDGRRRELRRVHRVRSERARRSATAARAAASAARAKRRRSRWVRTRG